MRKLIRILAGVIDYFLLYMPSLYLVQIIFSSKHNSIFLSQIIFIVLLTLCDLIFQQTPGKYFAKLKLNYSKQSYDWIQLSARESIKLLYFLPLFGVVLLMISLILFIMSGRFLHDLIVGREIVVC
ncbi:RDD family protein [Streptococcus parauberis]|uniref:RDD family protein n=1 Tax=Streptococcus parauberis TaxID=1348 RepID=UPI000E3079A4|nr:RDD family protein [Streptococcus parauberis]RFE01034.1 RDD family protein [Streptococcus parauberis]